jgi:glutamyl endopeptidase
MSKHAAVAHDHIQSLASVDSNPPSKELVRLRHPALRVLNGEFSDPPPEWRILDAHRDEIEARLPSVGRIRQGAFILGTGILVARNVVMTNRHVAESFSNDIDGAAKIRVGWKPVIDFIGEKPVVPTGAHAAAAAGASDHEHEHDHDHAEQPHEDEPCGCCQIKSILDVSKKPELDFALLRVSFDDSKGPEQWRRPRPLELNTTRALIDAKRPIYVIGFPRQDPTATAEEVKTVLGTYFGVKRVQPGVITRVDTGDSGVFEFEHDASTLKGNSGSCVIDLETNQVIGLHTRGSREEAGQVSFNRAIAFSRLPAEVLNVLRKAGIDVSGTDSRPQAD